MGAADLKGEYVEDWTLLTGHLICIRMTGRFVRVGHVETVTPDGDVLWLRSDGIEPRALFQTRRLHSVEEPHLTFANTPIPDSFGQKPRSTVSCFACTIPAWWAQG